MIAATGHAMIGISLAPMTGQLVAEIVGEEKPSVPIGLMSPDRFSSRNNLKRLGEKGVCYTQ
jgi:D-amino-acid dehydrogenase